MKNIRIGWRQHLQQIEAGESEPGQKFWGDSQDVTKDVIQSIVEMIGVGNHQEFDSPGLSVRITIDKIEAVK